MRNSGVTGRLGHLLVLLCFMASFAEAQVYFRQPPPGSVYKEYGRVQSGDELLVTDPNATATGAQDYLPNPVLNFTIDDLQGALDTVDVLIEQWGGHEATMGKAVRFNGNAWITVPELNPAVNGLQPGHYGQCYFHQVNNVIRVPKSHLVEGSNSIEGTNAGQNGCIDRWGNNLSWGWGLWGLNAFIVRVYYDPSKPHPDGFITSAASGGTLIESAQNKIQVTANASSPAGIERVDFMAYYDDYDQDGDGVYVQYHHQYPELPAASFDLTGHIGTDFSAPFAAEWVTKWVPDQPAGGVKLIARIKDNNGYWYVTSEVSGLSLQRSGRSVRLYKPYNVPEQFNLDNGQVKYCNFDIPPTTTLTDATDALLHIRTWNGTDADGVPGGRYTKVNDHTVTDAYGAGYEYRYNTLQIPPTSVMAGQNKVEFYGESVHHGIDIMWPGPAVAVELTGPGYFSPGITGTVLLSPASGTVNVPSAPTLTWRKTAGATAYTLQVGTDSTFAGGIVVNDTTITDTVRTLSGLAGNTTYYWRVRGRGPAGSGPSSSVWNFRTYIAPPSQVSPADNAVDQPTSVTLRWTRGSGVTSFRLQTATDPLFASGVIMDDSTLVDTSATLNGLANSTTYFWRVRGKSGGVSSAYSTTWKFTTVTGAAGIPVLLSPADGATGTPVSMVFSWTRPVNAATFRLQISTDPAFATGILVDESGITDTSRQVESLQNDTKYYWRVRALNSLAEPGTYATAFNFTTIIGSPTVPTIIAPVDGATNQPIVDLVFRWRGLPSATKYWLQLTTDSTFGGTFVKNDSSFADTFRVVSGLAQFMKYYWRVRAKNVVGFGAWTPTTRFTTVSPTPEQVQLVSPAPSASVGADSVRMVWHTAQHSTRYWFEAGLDSLFNMKFVDSTLADTTKVLRGLQNRQSYFWKIRGGNAGGWGAYSAVRKFTVLLTDVVSGRELPSAFTLGQNYPNPFNPSTMIEYGVPSEGRVTLEVYGVLGNKVATLVDEEKPAGYHTARFIADGLPSGIYFYRLIAGGTAVVKRMMYVR